MEFGIFDHVDRNRLALADYYEARLRLVEAYDRHGFYCYHVAEHHATPLGMASSPSVYLAAVAQRTRRLRFGPLVYLLPFYHPLRLIEEICLLDQMSRGRMQIGVGRGISPFETRYYGLDPDKTRQLSDEMLEVMVKGLTRKILSHDGPSYHLHEVPMELEPYQRPHPPLWMGVSSVASAQNAARRGLNIVSLLPAPAMRPIVEAYRGHAGDTGAKIGIAMFIIVGESDAAAREAAAAAYAAWRVSFNHLYRRHGTGPMLGEQPASFDDLARAGRGIAGTPDTVTAFLRDAVTQSGVNYLVGQFAFGDLDMAFAARSVELFAQEVMPALRASAIESISREGNQIDG